MANNINLVSGTGITCTLNQSNGTLTIQIKDSDLSSITTIKNILDTISSLQTTVKNLNDDLYNVKKVIQVYAQDDPWKEAKDGVLFKVDDKEVSPASLATAAISQSRGLIDFGTGDASSDANANAKIYIKHK